MGWTYELNRYNYTPKEYWLNEVLFRWNLTGQFKVVAQNSKGNEFYAAIQKMETKEVFAIVVLIEKHGKEIGFKEMDETSHPFYYNATKKLIKTLTPTDSNYANEWREKCLARYNKA